MKWLLPLREADSARDIDGVLRTIAAAGNGQGVREVELTLAGMLDEAGLAAWRAAACQLWSEGGTSIGYSCIDPGASLQAQHAAVGRLIAEMLPEQKDELYVYCGYGQATLEQLTIHEALQRYPDRVNLYVIGRAGTYIADADELLESERTYQVIRDLLLLWDFKAAGQLAKRSGIAESLPGLFDFGERLLQLKVQGSENAFEQLAALLSRYEAPTAMIDYVKRVKGLCSQEQTAFIQYLFSLTQLHYEQERMIDFMLLYYRLVEELLVYAFGFDLDYKGVLRARRQAHFQLRAPYQTQGTFGNLDRLLRDEVRTIERRYRFRLGDYGYMPRGMSDRDRFYTELYLLIAKPTFRELLELRHESVSGHGFADISKADVLGLTDGMHPVDLLKPLMEQLGLTTAFNLFHVLNHAILCLVDDEVFRLSGELEE